MNNFLKDIQPSIEKENEVKQAIVNLVGLTLMNLDFAVHQDLCEMIEKGHREGIDGYVLCLSRVVRHELGWELLTKAFEEKGEKVPSKYQRFFGQAPNQVLSKPQWSVG